jgi:hypothetical protein
MTGACRPGVTRRQPYDVSRLRSLVCTFCPDPPVVSSPAVATLAMADLIVVVDDGRMHEDGTHDDTDRVGRSLSRAVRAPGGRLPMRPVKLPMRGQGLAAPLFVVSGNQAAGKTTVSGLLAARFERGAHVSGDAMQTMIVAGRRWPEIPGDLDPDTGEVTGEAADQLRLRLKNACLLARSFAESGIMAVIDDIVVGTRFAELLGVNDEITGVGLLALWRETPAPYVSWLCGGGRVPAPFSKLVRARSKSERAAASSPWSGSQVVEVASGVGMVGALGLLTDGQGALKGGSAAASRPGPAAGRPGCWGVRWFETSCRHHTSIQFVWAGPTAIHQVSLAFLVCCHVALRIGKKWVTTVRGRRRYKLTTGRSRASVRTAR